MKKIIQYIAWILFFVLVILTMALAKNAQANLSMKTPQILFDVPKDMVFLKKEDVLNRFKLLGIQVDNVKKKEINTAYIEHILKTMPEVEAVKVYAELDGNWTIKLTIRRPIARIFNTKGESFYLDDKGKIMPLSKLYTARVTPVNGSIEVKNRHQTAKKIINNAPLKSISKLDQLYEISLYVCDDPFLDALISQIYVEPNGDFTLIPRVGEQKIIFGKVCNDSIVKTRFDKLKLFYQEAIPVVGWNTYSIINLKYKQQIVCTKK
jgi:cell division protein FtsQ